MKIVAGVELEISLQALKKLDQEKDTINKELGNDIRRNRIELPSMLGRAVRSRHHHP